MIKIARIPKPISMTDELEIALTAEFVIDNNKRVWDRQDIKDTLLEMSHSKCAYCECYIVEESKYMEVEHFYGKSSYPHLVIKWDNLLPSCKRCNVSKGTHNVVTEGMIVDPTINNPQDYFVLSPNYRMKKKCATGETTIDALDLNNIDMIVSCRFEVGQSIAATLEDILQITQEYDPNISTMRQKNRIVRGVRKILSEAAPHKEYSATAATEILRSEEFSSIKKILIGFGLWSDDLKEMEETAKKVALV